MEHKETDTIKKAWTNFRRVAQSSGQAQEKIRSIGFDHKRLDVEFDIGQQL